MRLPVSLRARGTRRVAAAVAVVVGLGVGASVAVLTVYQNVFDAARAYVDPDRLVIVENRGSYDLGQGLRTERHELSWPDYRDLHDRQRSFVALGGITGTDRLVAEIGGRLQSVPVAFVTSELLALTGVHATAGRLLGAADFDARAAPAALITEALWSTQFGRDDNIVGHAILIETQPVVIVGVIPDDAVTSFRQRKEIFDDADRSPRLILPLVRGGDGPAAARLSLRRSNRVFPMLTVIARLQPGRSLETAQTDIAGIAGQLAGEFPDSNAGRAFRAVRVTDWVTNSVNHLRPMLIAIAVLGLLVSCASALGLMMADVVRREPEMAVRHALGAGVGALTGLVLRRSILWALPGGVVGLTVAWALLRWVDVIGTGGSTTVSLSRPEALGAAAGLALIAGVVLGAVGVWMLRHQDFAAGVKEASGSMSASRRRRRVLTAIVGLQVAAATSLGFVSILLLRSMTNVYHVDLGFEAGQSFVFRVQLPQDHYRMAAEQQAFFDRGLSRIRALRGVASVALADAPPLTPVAVTIGSRDFAIEVPGRPPEALPPIGGQHVSVDYFDTLGMRFVRGRCFSQDEIRANAPVVVVDEAFWRARFADRDPLQALIRMGDTRFTIVGVVAGVRNGGPMSAPRPTVYLPHQGARAPAAYFVVRPSVPAFSIMERVAAGISSLDSRVLVDDPRMLSHLLQGTVAARERMSRLLSVSAGIVLLLTVFSVGGVLGEFVEHRVREIALRKALGASARHTLSLVCRSIAVPGVAGIVLGSVGGFFLARALSSELFGVEPFDLATLTATVLGLMAVGIAAAAGPIRRALWIEPASALRML